MDAKPQNLGGSLPVPNVQDLAARPADELTPLVLHRYIRDDVDADANGDAAASVPVVDLARLLDPSHGEQEAAKLKAACEDWGFFQVLNHGVPDAVIADVKADLQAFFGLPLAEKAAVAQEPGSIEGYGQHFVISADQKLDWADVLFLFTQPLEYRAPRFWPARPATFADSLDRYSGEVQRVATSLLAAMAANLGVADARKLTRIADSQSMRINYYPACPGGAHGRVLGLSPHSDAVGLTLLLQVSAVPGLQIRRHGAWVSVDPIPGALVANVGDVVEVLTNGRYKSIEHRAVVSPTHDRVSVAAFHSAKFGGTYAPLEETMVHGEPPGYKTISVEDYVRMLLSCKLEGKNIMDAMKINP
ncbi:hypothetical protein BDA96_01G006200 [Sorghum bicolor]|uniref:Fe2OG dioxygenase domain-containing protein n=2 Tax=Sorghum bicolor TaxID=4558 RepID=A0A921RVP9_SORBI|nr:S-norcoclaurine synthase 1 [Sorghum bicolor]KAG0546574.1 hypothetical protein BDA96_01G006200 [Sorghum bicolor]KXG37089.2 hypothetical protein SORBI_3001G006101 [Sorghum bicolor]|eukprot:XP_002466069.1 S-norcoclaurine synthase 1 [Sorghum bicolor]